MDLEQRFMSFMVYYSAHIKELEQGVCGNPFDEATQFMQAARKPSS